MGWPLSQDYNEAIQDPVQSFADPDLRGGEVVCNALGLPIPHSGNFADVYQVRCPNGDRWAVKCFTRQVAGLRERYGEVTRHLTAVKLPFAVDVRFLEQGIRVRGPWYPVLKMRWIEGLTLNEFVRDSADKPALLEALATMWVKMSKWLREANVTHADLQHGNVLLVPGSTPSALALKLIDYDGMIVPALMQRKSGELGHPAYQHPQRLREGTYSPEVDRFPLLAIVTALHCLRGGGKALWQKYDNGDNLLFREADFKAPTKSHLFYELLKTPDATAQKLVRSLLDACQGPLDRAPLIHELLPEPKPAPAAPKPLPQPAPAPKPTPIRSAVIAVVRAEPAKVVTLTPALAAARRRARSSSGWGLALACGVVLLALAGGGVYLARDRFATPDTPPEPEPLVVLATHPEPESPAPAPPKPLPTPPESPPEPQLAGLTDVHLTAGSRQRLHVRVNGARNGFKAELRELPPGVVAESVKVADGVAWDLVAGADAAAGEGHLTVVATVGEKVLRGDFKLTVTRPAAAEVPRPMPPPVAVTPKPAPKPPVKTKPLDQLVRERMPAWELTNAGGGDSKHAPAELVAVLGDSRLRHAHRVEGLAWSPDSTTLAAWGAEGPLSVWDAVTGQRRCTLQPTRPFGQAVFTPDRATLVTAEEGMIRLWDARTGDATGTVATDSQALPTVLAVSGDGKRMVVGGATDPVLTFLGGAPWKREGAARVAGVSGLRFSSPDGRALQAFGVDDRTLREWRFTSRQEVKAVTLDEKKRVEYFRDLSSDGQTLATVAGGSVNLWSTATGERRRTVAAVGGGDAARPQRGRAAPEPVRPGDPAPNFSGIDPLLDETFANPFKGPFARLPAVVGGEGVFVRGKYLFAATTTSAFAALGNTGHHGDLFCQATAQIKGDADDAWGLVLRGLNGQVRTVKVRHDGQLEVGSVESADNPFQEGPRPFAPPGGPLPTLLNTLAVAVRGNRLEVYVNGTAACEPVLLERRIAPVTVQLGFFGGKGKSLRVEVQRFTLWRLPPALRLPAPGETEPAAAFAPGGRLIAVRGRGEPVRLIDPANGKEVRRLPLTVPADVDVLALAFSPDGKALAAADSDGRVRVWDVAGNERFADGPPHTPQAVAISPDGRWVLTAGHDREGRPELARWDLTNSSAVKTLPYADADLLDVDVSPDGTTAAGAGADGTVLLWEHDSDKSPVRLRGHTGPVRLVRWSPPDGKRVVTAGDDGTVRLWDPVAGMEVRALKGHAGPVRAAAFHPAGRLLATAGQDGAVKLWDVAGGKELLTVQQPRPGRPSHALAFAADGTLAFATDASVLRWKVEPGKAGAAPKVQELQPPLQGHEGAVTSLAYHPVRGELASLGADGTLRIWDEKGSLIRLLRGAVPARTAEPGRVVFSPEGRHLLVWRPDRTVAVYRVEAPRVDGSAAKE